MECGLFQYLGSRGAQQNRLRSILAKPYVSILGLARSPTQNGAVTVKVKISFNTWAREEPNSFSDSSQSQRDNVSILGLARSPTHCDLETDFRKIVSILGLARSPTDEELNVFKERGVSILGLARSPT